MKKLILLILSLIGFYSFGQELTCKDFKEGKFVAEMTEPVKFQWNIIRKNNHQTESPGELPEELKGTDFQPDHKYGIIEWIDDCNYILTYDSTITELTDTQKLINKLGGVVNKMLKIENGCFYYISTLKYEGGEQSIEGKFCKI